MHRAPTFRSLVLAGLLAALMGPATSWAQQNREAELYKGWSLSRVRVTGLPSELSSRVRSGLTLTNASGLFRRQYGIFYPDILEEDLRRIRLHLARNGYPRARIQTLFEPQPIPQKIQLTIEVDPGPAVRVEEVVIDGLPENLTRRARRIMTVEEDGVFSEERLIESGAELTLVLRNGGYAKATVEPEVEEGSANSVRVRFVVTAEQSYVFGDIHVEGIGEDLVPLAGRTINLHPGQPYSAQSLTRAHENLRLLNLFRQIRLSIEKAAPGTLDVVAVLSERDPRTIEVRAGFWSEDKFRGRFSWQHRNPFGGGRGVGFYITGSKFLVESEVSMWWPALIAPRTREAVALGVRGEIEDNYTQIGVGVEVSSTYRPTLRTTFRGAGAVTYVKVDEDNRTPEFDSEGIIVPLTGTWRWDTSDNPLDPTRGKVVWTDLQWTVPGISDNEYIRNETGGNLYLPVLRRGVFAIRLVVGLGKPIGGSEELIPGNRFYAGGTNSNRGFHRRKLGPLDAAGDPLGGRLSIITMTELRFRLFWILEGAIFLDVGQVWRKASHAKFSDFEPSAGPALMVKTPVGPLRFDYGIRLKDPGDQPHAVLQFMIGHPF